jgi:uncharacterized membrane protein
MYSKVTIGGHPVHPMLIAFPIAFYTGTLVSHLIYASNHDIFWYRTAFAANVAGVVMAVAAAVPGFIDWWAGIPRNSEPKRDGLIHASLNVIALVLFAINLAITANRWNEVPLPASAGPVILSLVGVLSTVGAGWFGWRLVQTHHVGVDVSVDRLRMEPVSRPEQRGYPPGRTGTGDR